jgi:diguanylate cyclase
VNSLNIDLDRFKVINDTHGHAAGDVVLKKFARLAQQVSRGSDMFGRWGGEEFLWLLPE